MKYVYFVSYDHTKGSGNVIITVPYKVDSVENYNKVVALIDETKQKAGISGIVIKNFVLIRKKLF